MLGATCSTTQALWHFCLTYYSSGWTALSLDEVIPEHQPVFLGFSSRQGLTHRILPSRSLKRAVCSLEIVIKNFLAGTGALPQHTHIKKTLKNQNLFFFFPRCYAPKGPESTSSKNTETVFILTHMFPLGSLSELKLSYSKKQNKTRHNSAFYLDKSYSKNKNS